jgi:pimeloyl-ACP methyl ester carboxylesterase
MSIPTRLLAAGVAGLILTGSLVVPTVATSAAAAVPAPDTTSPLEAWRVDSVPTPHLPWYKCYGTAQCATVRLPLDYDDPYGETVEIAVLKMKARKPASRIGSLFVNPGGPGGSGTEMAALSPLFLSGAVLDRFDVVGFDPRGVGFSDNLKCFPTTARQTQVLSGLQAFFPYGANQERGYVNSAQAVGRGCSRTGAKLAGAMSTAEVARDMDVLRRAVGDKKLTYLGFSYGSLLGQYYANMFPDRVRALALDGIINPITWVGSPATANRLLDDRLNSADGAYKALQRLLIRCDQAGEKRCMFAKGDPRKHFEAIARKLRAKPLVLGTDEDLGPVRLTYADFVGITLMGLYTPVAGELVTAIASLIETLLADPAATTGAQRSAARSALRERLTHVRAPGRDFPYDNSYEAFAGVMCTDALHPGDAGGWPALTAAADRRAPYFGRAWGWSSVPCAGDTWTVRDEDAYQGPFNRRTSAPVLVVGNYWDPATNYGQAVSAARLLPNSRLLTSDNWGHTAYGTSTCVTRAIDTYLVRGSVPPAGTKCHSPLQPFTGNGGIPLLLSAGAEPATMGAQAGDHVAVPGGAKALPPVRAPHPYH